MSETELWRLSAVQLLQGYAQRDFSPVEVLSELYERADQLNPVLSSFLVLNSADAFVAARTAEKIWMSSGERPPLCGVPISIKDSIEVRGLPTTYGSVPFKENYQPDAELVRRIRRAGGVITGKTNLPEFALHGAVDNLFSAVGRNPWNLTHTCGGSSGGAGSSVAVGLGPIGIGTDSGGSIRMPAAANGIYGIKPTYQRIPAVQTWRAAPGRSHNGPLTRTVGDAALLLQAIGGYDPRDAESRLPSIDDYLAFSRGDIRGVRVAVSYDFGNDFPMDPEAIALVREIAGLLSELGCQVVPANPPIIGETEELEPGIWAYAGDHYAAAEAMLPNFLENHLEQLGPNAKAIYAAGPFAKAWQYRRIVRRNRAYGLQMQEWFKDYDFLLSPCIGPAGEIAEMSPADRSRVPSSFTSPFNHTYNPAASVPSGFHSNGMPLAFQLVGRLGDDVGVLRLSAAVEAARPWGHLWPAMANDSSLAAIPEIQGD